MSAAIIEVENLTVQFGDRVVLDNISFTVERGEVLVVLGGSGCGKSTLLNHMVGLLEPKAGKINIAGSDIVQSFGSDRDNILAHIGVMFQSGALFGSMTLLENVRLPLEEKTNLPMNIMNTIARHKLKLVGLKDFVDFMPAEISGGMQKRAAIARALALDPEILFLDEPSAGLDPITSANLDQLILHLSQVLGVTFVVVSHELPSIYTIADRVIMLHDGHIVATGKPQQLRDHSDNDFVKRFFNREAIVEANGG